MNFKFCCLVNPTVALQFFDEIGLGFGAVISQKQDDGGVIVIAYASRTTNEHGKNYAPTQLECAAVIWAVELFKVYLVDTPFQLARLKKLKDTNSMPEM